MARQMSLFSSGFSMVPALWQSPHIVSVQPVPPDGVNYNIDGMSLDQKACMDWIYPKNMEVRQYQVKFVTDALYANTLVCLPTGTGKTFIAAVVMYNFYRWFPDGKVVFMAPTKPLVLQQEKACFTCTGTPQQDTTLLTGMQTKSARQQAWLTKRVVFCTPQVLQNDLADGTCDARSLVCLVFDEAHKAVGNFAYVEVVKQISAVSSRFRVLGLSATPGKDKHKIQEVIRNLRIAKMHVIGEDDAEMRRYMHERKMDIVVVNMNADGGQYRLLIDKTLAVVNLAYSQLKKASPIFKNVAVGKTSSWTIGELGKKARSIIPAPRRAFLENAIRCAQPLTDIYHDLTVYGIETFLGRLAEFRKMADSHEFCRDIAMGNPFIRLWDAAQSAGEQKLMHPKQERLLALLIHHFTINRDGGTRAIVFASLRDTQWSRIPVEFSTRICGSGDLGSIQHGLHL